MAGKGTVPIVLFVDGGEESTRAQQLLRQSGVEFTPRRVREEERDELPPPLLMTPRGTFEGIQGVQDYLEVERLLAEPAG